jgi:Uma2 family endonuclease
MRSPRFTADEFLAWETEQTERWEFVDGECFAMSGGTDIHNTICLNLAFALRERLRGGRCSVFMSDMKLKVEATAADEMFFYPDVFVTCNASDRSHRLCKSAPTLIAEVLSPSTEAYDRGMKFEAYRGIPGLSTVLFIDPARPRVECYTRTATGGWLLTEAQGMNGAIPLFDSEYTLSLGELYRDLPDDQ